MFRAEIDPLEAEAMAVDYKILSDEDLASRFETLCLEQHRSLDREEISEFNKRFDVIQAIEDELQSRAGDRRIILRQFYNHRNSQVALTAARATLAIDYADARRTIEEIAESDDFPQAGDAGMALWAMDEGIYKPI
jgi:hypothetical protein